MKQRTYFRLGWEKWGWEFGDTHFLPHMTEWYVTRLIEDHPEL